MPVGGKSSACSVNLTDGIASWIPDDRLFACAVCEMLPRKNVTAPVHPGSRGREEGASRCEAGQCPREVTTGPIGTETHGIGTSPITKKNVPNKRVENVVGMQSGFAVRMIISTLPAHGCFLKNCSEVHVKGDKGTQNLYLDLADYFNIWLIMGLPSYCDVLI